MIKQTTNFSPSPTLPLDMNTVDCIKFSINFTGPRAYFASDDKNLNDTNYEFGKKFTTNSDMKEIKFQTIKTNIDNYLAEYKKESIFFLHLL